MRASVTQAVPRFAAGLLLAFLTLPLLGLVTATTPQEIIAGLSHPLVAPALRLSAITTTISLSTVIVLGLPLAWFIARNPTRLARMIETMVQLPVVIPPAVAGLALLLAFGRRGLLAGLYPDGWSFAFSTTAVIMAEVFVSAPFFVQTAAAAFRRIDRRVLDVARSLGASPVRVFWRVAVPLARPGLIAGAAMSWARSLGEFGATLMFAGNIEGRTQTLPLAVYTAMESELRAAQAIALVLVLVAFLLLIVMRAAAARLPDPLDATERAP